MVVPVVVDSNAIPCSAPPGTVLMSFPEKCLQMVCGLSSEIEPLYLHSKDSCHCKYILLLYIN